MLDFKDPDLYRAKEREYNKFLMDVLRTRNDIKERELYENATQVSDEALVDGMNEIAEEQGVTVEEMVRHVAEDVKEDRDSTSLFIEETKLGTPYETNHFWKNLAVSPYYLFYYIARSIGSHIGERGSLAKYMQSLMFVSGITSAITLMLLFFTDAKFIFSLPVQAIASVTLFVVSFATMFAIKNPDVMKIRLVKDDDLVELEKNAESDIKESEDELDIFDLEDKLVREEEDRRIEEVRQFAIMGGMDPDEAVAMMGNVDNRDLDQLKADVAGSAETEEALSGDVLDVVEKRTSSAVNPGSSPVPHSLVDVNHKGDDFLNDLSEVFARNAKYEGKRFSNRKDLVISLSDYLIANDKSFGSWDELPEFGTEYSNIMFTLYLALCEINSAYPKAEEALHVFKVLEAKENPLMYKVEIEVPRAFFKEGQLKSVSGKNVFMSRLRKSDDDMDVRYIISSYQEGFVIKLFKKAKGFVSLGDIVRYHDEDSSETQAYEHFLGEKMGLPMILGLRNNEYPTVIDLAENTSVVIAGESGSGKSWGTFLVMKNLVCTNDYNDLNVVVMDKKKAVFWREFARLPHVIGYHTHVPDYFDILKEIKEEMEFRKALLQKADKENWKSLRKELKDQGDTESLKAFPWLIVIIDEISNTLKEVMSIAGEDNKHIYDTFLADLAQLAQEGRSLGIKLMLIGQRTIANSMPKDVMVNASMKFGFKLASADMERLINDKEVLNRLPSTVGEAYVVDFVSSNPMFLRTLTVGGVDDHQIVNLIRTLAFEWTRRAKGDTFMVPPTMPFTYNRHVIQEMVLKDLEAGKMFIGGATESKVADLARALMSGEDILSGSADPDLIPVKIAKEDKFGNVLDENINKPREEPAVKISAKESSVAVSKGSPSPGSRKTSAVMDPPKSESEYIVSKPSISLRKEDNDVVDDRSNEVVERTPDPIADVDEIKTNVSDTGNSMDIRDDWDFVIGDDDLLPDEKPRDEAVEVRQEVQTDVRGNVLEKVELTEDELFKWDNVSADRTDAPKRKMMGGVVRKKTVDTSQSKAKEKVLQTLQEREEIINAPEDGVKDVFIPDRGGLSVSMYIKTYGVGVGTKKMPRDVVSKVFTKVEIERALSSLLIVQDGDTYQA